MLVSVNVTMLSLVKFLFRIVLALVKFAYKKLSSYFSSIWGRTSLIGNLPISTDLSIIPETSAETTVSRISDRGLNLPQTLALHPEQWVALEAQARLSVTDAEQVAHTDAMNSYRQPAYNTTGSQVAYRQLASSSADEPSVIPLRRSRRDRRARVFYSS